MTRQEAVEAAGRRRMRLIVAELGLDPAHSRGSTDEQVRSLLADASLTAETRAAVAFLACTGSYATEEQQRELAGWIGAGSLEHCLALLARWARGAPGRARRRVLLRSPGTLVDLSRTSRAVETTGIPRVARALAAEAVDRGSVPVVWEGGVPGPVVLGDSPSGVDFPDEAWGRAGLRRRVGSALKDGYWRAMRRLSLLPGGTRVVHSVRAVAAPIGDAVNGRSGPTHAYLLAHCHYVSPEVNRPHSATRLLAWRRACSTLDLTFTLHDLLPLVEPGFFAPDQRVEHIDFARLVARSDRVVVSSTHLVDQVTGLSGLMGVDQSPAVDVVPYGSDAASWVPVPMAPGDRPAFVMVGSMERRKNHALALRALALLAQRDLPATLHVVGSARPVDRDTRVALDHARRCGVDVLEHRGADDSVLAGIMDSCVASLYLSWAEGYGLPVIESLSRGLPVVVSDIPAHRDHLARAGVLATAVDRPEELADLLERLLADERRMSLLRSSIDPSSLPTGYTRWADRILAP